MRISDWSSDVCSSDLHLKSVIVPSVQSPPSMLKLHDFCNRAPALARCAPASARNRESRYSRARRSAPRSRRAATPPRHAPTPTDPRPARTPAPDRQRRQNYHPLRSEEHTSELQSLMRISYAVFRLKKKNVHISQPLL